MSNISLRCWLLSLPLFGPSRSKQGVIPSKVYTAPAFTMVELMAVIGVIALLAVVGVPAIKGLTGSGGRKQALAQLLGAMEIARNTAIAEGTNAAVIFPDQTIDKEPAFGGTNGPYRYRSMAIVTWYTRTNATNDSCKMIGSWIALPQGVALHPLAIQKNLPVISNVTVQILTATITNLTMPGIMFQSDGALAESLNPPIPTNGVTLFEGTVSGQNPVYLTKNTNALETVRLTRYTGRPRPTVISITNL